MFYRADGAIKMTSLGSRDRLLHIHGYLALFVVVVSKVSTSALSVPCGRIQMNPTNAICCQDLVFVRSGFRAACCGRIGYDSQRFLCCGNTIVRKTGTHQLCCGNRGFDVTQQVCTESGDVMPRTQLGTTCCQTANGWRCCSKGEGCCAGGAEALEEGGSGEVIDIPGFRPACCSLNSIPEKAECCRGTMERIGALPGCCDTYLLKPICCRRPGGAILCCTPERGYCCGKGDEYLDNQPILPDDRGSDEGDSYIPMWALTHIPTLRPLRPTTQPFYPAGTKPPPLYPEHPGGTQRPPYYPVQPNNPPESYQETYRPTRTPNGGHRPNPEPTAYQPHSVPVSPTPDTGDLTMTFDDLYDLEESGVGTCCQSSRPQAQCCSTSLRPPRPACCHGYQRPTCCHSYHARTGCCARRPQRHQYPFHRHHLPHYSSQTNCCNTRQPHWRCCPLVAEMKRRLANNQKPQCCRSEVSPGQRPACCLANIRWPICCTSVSVDRSSERSDHSEESYESEQSDESEESDRSVQSEGSQQSDQSRQSDESKKTDKSKNSDEKKYSAESEDTDDLYLGKETGDPNRPGGHLIDLDHYFTSLTEQPHHNLGQPDRGQQEVIDGSSLDPYDPQPHDISREEEGFISVSCCGAITQTAKHTCCVSEFRRVGVTPKCCSLLECTGEKVLLSSTESHRSTLGQQDRMTAHPLPYTDKLTTTTDSTPTGLTTPSSPLTALCQGQPYNPQRLICCGGSLQWREGSSSACCGSFVYDTAEWQCCDGVVKPDCDFHKLEKPKVLGISVNVVKNGHRETHYDNQ